MSEDAEYWKQKYLQREALYQDKMRELNDFGFLLQQFSRENMTRAQKEEAQRKLQGTIVSSPEPGPGSS